MRLKEANKLQELAAETHPLLEVHILKIEAEHVDAWTCYLDFNKTQYYLWNIQDWLVYKEQYKRRLDVYTEAGKRRRVENWRKSIAANKANKRGLLTA